MSGEHYRYCEECEEEFRPEIAACSDCGGPLVDRYEGMEEPTSETIAPTPPRDLPVDVKSFVHLFAAERKVDAEKIARRLARAGIAYAVAPAGSWSSGFVLSVPEDRLEAAREHLPNLTETPIEGLDPEHGYTVCPACGRVGVGGLAECPDCGLVLKAEDESTPERDPGGE